MEAQQPYGLCKLLIIPGHLKKGLEKTYHGSPRAVQRAPVRTRLMYSMLLNDNAVYSACARASWGGESTNSVSVIYGNGIQKRYQNKE